MKNKSFSHFIFINLSMESGSKFDDNISIEDQSG
jgi:hypothetical protein